MRPRPFALAAVASVGLATTVVHAAPSVGSTVTSAPAPPPPTPTPPATSPTPAPKASADSRRMVATTFTSMVVYENGAGYLHAFWRTLGTPGPDTAARLQWGRGCPEISDRVFMAIHTAFASPDRFFLIVDKAADARQPGAYCVTGVELEAIGRPPTPPLVTPPPTTPAARQQGPEHADTTPLIRPVPRDSNEATAPDGGSSRRSDRRRECGLRTADQRWQIAHELPVKPASAQRSGRREDLVRAVESAPASRHGPPDRRGLPSRFSAAPATLPLPP